MKFFIIMRGAMETKKNKCLQINEYFEVITCNKPKMLSGPPTIKNFALLDLQVMWLCTTLNRFGTL